MRGAEPHGTSREANCQSGRGGVHREVVKRFRALLPLCLLVVFCCGASAALFDVDKKKTGGGVSDQQKKHGPGLLDRLFAKFHSPAPAPGASTAERWVGKQRLSLNMTVDPATPKLGEARQLKVTLQLSNHEKKMVQLEFPTTQRLEVLIRDKVGKLVEQWSEDHTFANDPGMVSVNPGEHLEYSVSVSTRDLVAGQTYTVEALFPNYESLRLQKDITPVK